MRFNQLALSTASALLLASPAYANNTTAERVAIPTDDDFAAAEKLVEPIIENLAAGYAENAVDLAFGNSPLMDAKSSQTKLLVQQVEGAIELYGQINQCALAERDSFSSLSIDLTYICQHENFLIMWDFRLHKLPRGWSIANMKFTDQF